MAGIAQAGDDFGLDRQLHGRAAERFGRERTGNTVELEQDAARLDAEAFSRAAMKLPVKTKVVARLGDTSHLGGE